MEALMAVPETNASQTSSGAESQRGTGVLNRVRDSAAAQLTTQKDKATDGIGSVAQAVRQSTQQLRDHQHDTLAGYVESAANQIEQFSQRLRDKDVGELVEDAQRLARRQPALFIGSAFALGLLGVRFLKSSARRDREYGETERIRSHAGREYERGPSPSYGTPSSLSIGSTDYTAGTNVVTGGGERYTGGGADATEGASPSSTSTGGGRKPRPGKIERS
jgi:hypothetical protein